MQIRALGSGELVGGSNPIPVAKVWGVHVSRGQLERTYSDSFSVLLIHLLASGYSLLWISLF